MSENEYFDKKKFREIWPLDGCGEEEVSDQIAMESFITSEIKRNRLESVRDFMNRLSFKKHDRFCHCDACDICELSDRVLSEIEAELK